VSLERISGLRTDTPPQHVGAGQYDWAKRRRYACHFEPKKLDDINWHLITERVGEVRNL
jgi:hypothetical protein